MGEFVKARTKMIVFGLLPISAVILTLNTGWSDLTTFALITYGIAFLFLLKEHEKDKYWSKRERECDHHYEVFLHSTKLINPYYCSGCCKGFNESQIVEKEGKFYLNPILCKTTSESSKA